MRAPVRLLSFVGLCGRKAGEGPAGEGEGDGSGVGPGSGAGPGAERRYLKLGRRVGWISTFVGLMCSYTSFFHSVEVANTSERIRRHIQMRYELLRFALRRREEHQTGDYVSGGEGFSSAEGFSRLFRYGYGSDRELSDSADAESMATGGTNARAAAGKDSMNPYPVPVPAHLRGTLLDWNTFPDSTGRAGEENAFAHAFEENFSFWSMPLAQHAPGAEMGEGGVSARAGEFALFRHSAVSCFLTLNYWNVIFLIACVTGLLVVTMLFRHPWWTRVPLDAADCDQTLSDREEEKTRETSVSASARSSGGLCRRPEYFFHFAARLHELRLEREAARLERGETTNSDCSSGFSSAMSSAAPTALVVVNAGSASESDDVSGEDTRSTEEADADAARISSAAACRASIAGSTPKAAAAHLREWRRAMLQSWHATGTELLPSSAGLGRESGDCLLSANLSGSGASLATMGTRASGDGSPCGMREERREGGQTRREEKKEPETETEPKCSGKKGEKRRTKLVFHWINCALSILGIGGAIGLFGLCACCESASVLFIGPTAGYGHGGTGILYRDYVDEDQALKAPVEEVESSEPVTKDSNELQPQPSSWRVAAKVKAAQLQTRLRRSPLGRRLGFDCKEQSSTQDDESAQLKRGERQRPLTPTTLVRCAAELGALPIHALTRTNRWLRQLFLHGLLDAERLLKDAETLDLGGGQSYPRLRGIPLILTQEELRLWKTMPWLYGRDRNISRSAFRLSENLCGAGGCLIDEHLSMTLDYLQPVRLPRSAVEEKPTGSKRSGSDQPEKREVPGDDASATLTTTILTQPTTIRILPVRDIHSQPALFLLKWIYSTVFRVLELLGFPRGSGEKAPAGGKAGGRETRESQTGQGLGDRVWLSLVNGLQDVVEHFAQGTPKHMFFAISMFTCFLGHFALSFLLLCVELFYHVRLGRAERRLGTRGGRDREADARAGTGQKGNGESRCCRLAWHVGALAVQFTCSCLALLGLALWDLAAGERGTSFSRFNAWEWCSVLAVVSFFWSLFMVDMAVWRRGKYYRAGRRK